MFLEYNQGDSFLHNLDIRTKVFGFIVIVVSTFLFNSPIYNFSILIICIGLMAVSKIPFERLKVILKPLLPILILIIMLSSISYNPEYFQKEFSQTVLFSLFQGDAVSCTIGGLFLGLSLSIRIFTMVIASTLLTYTTPIDDFIHILRLMRVSHKITFVITTGLRFIPTMEKKAQQIIDAQRVRGADFQEGNLIRKIKAYIPVMIPMIVESLRMSENLAMAMLNRGFGASKNWTIINEFNLKFKDVIILIILFIIISITIYLKILGFGKL